MGKKRKLKKLAAQKARDEMLQRAYALKKANNDMENRNKALQGEAPLLTEHVIGIRQWRFFIDLSPVWSLT